MRQTTETKAARGAHCVICGTNDGTTVLAHYSGMRQHELGKGRGIKGRDDYAAAVCASCHDASAFAEGYIPKGTEGWPRDARRALVSEEQLYLILKWRDMQYQLNQYKQ